MNPDLPPCAEQKSLAESVADRSYTSAFKPVRSCCADSRSEADRWATVPGLSGAEVCSKPCASDSRERQS